MLCVLAHREHRHLVRAPRAFDLHAVHLARARPALRCAQDQHRPARARRRSAAGLVLERTDVVERRVERGGEALVRVPRRLVELAETISGRQP